MTLTAYDINRLSEISNILNKLELNPRHIDVIRDARTNMGAVLPYHNSQHMITVAINAYDTARYYNLDENETRLLTLAGLYHDFNHTGGTRVDLINVANAITGMTLMVGRMEPNLAAEHINTIAQYILITEHPRRFEVNSIPEKIMRDSDMLQWCEPDFDRWASGLSRETGHHVDFESTKKFLSTVKLYSYRTKTKLARVGLVSASW